MPPQNSAVVPGGRVSRQRLRDDLRRPYEDIPQNPNSLQQTFRGHFSAAAHSAPQPGLHSLLASQVDVHPSPQNFGPRPQTPLPLSSLHLKCQPMGFLIRRSDDRLTKGHSIQVDTHESEYMYNLLQIEQLQFEFGGSGLPTGRR